MKINKKMILFVLFFYLFLFRDYLETKIEILGYLDEAAAVCAIPLFLSKFTSKNRGTNVRGPVVGGKYILICAAIGLVSSYVYKYQGTAAIFSDLLLVTKFWLAVYVGVVWGGRFSIARFGKRIYPHIKFITWLYTILIAADNIFNIFPTDIRYGFRSTRLMYSHPTVFVSNCVLLIAILLSIRNQVTSGKRYLVMLLVMMCTSFRSKAFGAAVAISLIYYFVYMRRKKLRIRTLLLLVPLIIAMGWEQIEYYFLSSIHSGVARYQLLVKSFVIAKDHFPLGAGFASFASHFSGKYYSPVYSMYGISDIYGITITNTNFINDCFWPMILGQFGWFGLLAFCAALFSLFKRIQEMRSFNMAFYVSGLSIFVHLLIASFAESAFVHPLSIPLAIWLGVLFGNMTKKDALPGAGQANKRQGARVEDAAGRMP